jgi:hypothetical protein
MKSIAMAVLLSSRTADVLETLMFTAASFVVAAGTLELCLPGVFGLT